MYNLATMDGIECMYGPNTAPTLIIKTIFFHLSVNMKEWPPVSPLSNEETQRYFDKELLPLLKVMNLGDTDGWTLFEPSTREPLRADMIDAFEALDKLIVY